MMEGAQELPFAICRLASYRLASYVAYPHKYWDVVATALEAVFPAAWSKPYRAGSSEQPVAADWKPLCCFQFSTGLQELQNLAAADHTCYFAIRDHRQLVHVLFDHQFQYLSERCIR